MVVPSSTFVSFPVQILLKVIGDLNNTFDKTYRRSNVYNLMCTCKLLYAISLPHLYTDVFLKDPVKSSSFFRALPEKGHYVCRLRFDEDRSPHNGTRKDVHKNTFVPEELSSITQYCTNLRQLFIGCDCAEWVGSPEEFVETLEELDCWLQELIKERPTLELFVPPRQWATDQWVVPGHVNYAFGGLYIPLGDNLTRLFVSNSRSLSSRVVQVAKACVRLQEVYLYEVSVIIDDFIKFLHLIPDLVILHLDAVRFGSRNAFAKSDEENMATVLETLPSTSPRLHTLVLHHVELPHVFPTITPESFPNLRVLDLFDGHYVFWRLLPHPPLHARLRNLQEFLQNLRALKILHITDFHIRLVGSNVFVWDILPPQVEVFTSQNPDSMCTAIAGAIATGRLKNTYGISSEQWPGIQVDGFVRNWRFFQLENEEEIDYKDWRF